MNQTRKLLTGGVIFAAVLCSMSLMLGCGHDNPLTSTNPATAGGGSNIKSDPRDAFAASVTTTGADSSVVWAEGR